ncbi:hypothetical protein SPSIL_053810 [Sporomusa silvacetica DSM 10669]|uniref:Leucine/isoleucine/valine transporter permease subunit n=1 Tax=Sporomusa silvacetica DSM 10669 TaxID=1123289 RepID=A0ABZ3IUD8_9FIRM|nr:branched-chain amino acid ABC transporter permease [Sporomusa silvacetica]OZC19529.1 leucine/isoleucine/valine transporter permease subunit [Sporomusa silvacetica DSM 10669]
MKNIIHSKQRLLIIIGILVLFAIVASSDYLMFLSIFSSINAIAVLGIVLISGLTGQLHLGQAALVGIGAYVSAILMLKAGMSFWLTIPISVISSAVVGCVLGIPTLKLSGGSYLALVTQTFGEIIYILILNAVDLTGGPFGIAGIKVPEIGSFKFDSLQSYFFLCVIILFVLYCVAKQIIQSRYGRIFISIKESEAAAQSVGINTMKYKILAFTLAAAFGGFAGVLYGPFIGYLSPEQFRWQPSLLLISMGIIGGLSSLEGGIMGSFILTFLPELLRATDQYRLILYGILLIFTLAFLPSGIVSLFGKSVKEIKAMFKERYMIIFDKTIVKASQSK